MASQRDLEILFEQVAQHLSKRRDVKVRLRNPLCDIASAQIYKTTTGGCVIDINPGNEFERQIVNLLHEVAHLNYDFQTIPANNNHLRPPSSSTKTDAERARARASLMERRADAQAAQWLAWAKSNANYYQQEPAGLLWLRALLNHP
jgi:hypothetical protein